MTTTGELADTEPTAREATLVGQVLFDRLRVDCVLGRGGMGTVYRVTHLVTRHVRALKVMHAELSETEHCAIRMLREASVSGVLASPHVVETLDSGTLPDGSPFVLMEMLDGEPLSETIAREQRMDCHRVARLLAGPCQALAKAHEAGIVHRDLKPDNLFLCHPSTADERVRVMDFGIAHFAAPTDEQGTLTTQRMVLGTPSYMAPEQLMASRHVDGKADVYSLGVVLYELASGKRPFLVDSFADLMRRATDPDYLALERLQDGLPSAYYDIVRRALAVRPEERPMMAELAEILAQLGESSSAAATHASQSTARRVDARFAPASLAVSSSLDAPPPSSENPSFGPESLGVQLTLGASHLPAKSRVGILLGALAAIALIAAALVGAQRFARVEAADSVPRASALPHQRVLPTGARSAAQGTPDSAAESSVSAAESPIETNPGDAVEVPASAERSPAPQRRRGTRAAISRTIESARLSAPRATEPPRTPEGFVLPRRTAESEHLDLDAYGE